MIERVLGWLVDIAPDWLWKPGNVRWVGSRILHFCYDGSGHRTVEFDSTTVASGRRIHDPSDDIHER